MLSSTLVITKNLTVDGGGLAIPVTLSGNNAVRVMQVSNNARVTLSSLTLTRGKDAGTSCASASSCGGGLKVDTGAVVTLTNSTIFSNTGYYGGGIYSTGVLTVQNSTLYSNTAGLAGGGIANAAPGTLVVLNSTLSGNTGPNGGGILNENALTLLNSTLSGNIGTGTNGGGLRDTGRR